MAPPKKKAVPTNKPVPAVLYRIVKRNPPGVDDFKSNAERGRPTPKDDVAARLWDGVSLQDSLKRAREKATDIPMLGDYVAEVRLPEGVRVEKTGRSHYTAWGRSATLHAAIGDVFPVREVD